MAKMRRTWTLVLGIVGVLLVVASFVWTAVAVPKLVKYPSDVDETPVYAGQVTLYVDPATTAPLSSPKVFPLQVSRNVKVVSSTSSTVVVKETAALKATGLFDSVQEQEYVMNRRSMLNQKDDRSWAFEPTNIVDRSGAYRLNFPLDNKAQPYPIYSNEAQFTYQVKPDPAAPSGTVQGLSVHSYLADFGYQPASEAYLRSLDTSLSSPLPRQLGLDKLSPLLASAGIDLTKLLPALLPALSSQDRDAVLALAQQPVKLVYLFKAKGADAADQSTGGIVQVHDVEQTLAAAPDPALLPTLQALLSKYPQVAGVSDTLTNLQKLASSPIKIFDNTFSQTPDSVKDIAATVQDNADRKQLVETTIPLVLLVGGVVLAVIGLALFLFWRKGPKPVAAAAGPAVPAAATPPTGASMGPPPADEAGDRHEPPPGGSPP